MAEPCRSADRSRRVRSRGHRRDDEAQVVVAHRRFSLDGRTEVCNGCAVALRLTTDTGEWRVLETPGRMTDREVAHDLIRRTWLAASGWAQTSSGMVNLDHVVRIEAAGVSESAAEIADDERDVQAPAGDPREACGRRSRIS